MNDPTPLDRRPGKTASLDWAAHAETSFEDLLTDLAASFINVEASALDAHIQAALRRIVLFLGLDRCTIGRFDDVRAEWTVTHSWAQEGIAPIPSPLAEAHFPYLVGRLRAELPTIVAERLADLPPEAALDRQSPDLARANLALSLTLTALSTLLALVSMPLLTAAGIALFLNQPDAIPVPVAPMVGQMVLMLLLPLGLGIALRLWWPGLVHHERRWLRWLSLLGLAALVGAILYAQRADLASGLGPMVTAALVLSGAAMLTGWVLSWLVGLNRRDRFTRRVTSTCACCYRLWRNA